MTEFDFSKNFDNKLYKERNSGQHKNQFINMAAETPIVYDPVFTTDKKQQHSGNFVDVTVFDHNDCPRVVLIRIHDKVLQVHPSTVFVEK